MWTYMDMWIDAEPTPLLPNSCTRQFGASYFTSRMLHTYPGLMQSVPNHGYSQSYEIYFCTTTNSSNNIYGGSCLYLSVTMCLHGQLRGTSLSARMDKQLYTSVSCGNGTLHITQGSHNGHGQLTPCEVVVLDPRPVCRLIRQRGTSTAVDMPIARGIL